MCLRAGSILPQIVAGADGRSFVGLTLMLVSLLSKQCRNSGTFLCLSRMHPSWRGFATGEQRRLGVVGDSLRHSSQRPEDGQASFYWLKHWRPTVLPASSAPRPRVLGPFATNLTEMASSTELRKKKTSLPTSPHSITVSCFISSS